MIRPQVGSPSLLIFDQSIVIIPTHFTILVVPHIVCFRPAYSPPLYQSLSSGISATVLIHHSLHCWPCLTSPLYPSDNTPSSWYLFPVNILPVYCCPNNPFHHLRHPTSHIFMSHIWWIMTLSKIQDGYLNHRVVLFGLQYEIHSLQMHPTSPCRSVVAPRPEKLERWYALRLVVLPCWYLTSPLSLFQPISPS